ncbi:hypothetical protein LUZ60_000416 [Juncus effusus]|nr:hypothetical protein LUZ60_000416 [Juncus effusus]
MMHLPCASKRLRSILARGESIILGALLEAACGEQCSCNLRLASDELCYHQHLHVTIRLLHDAVGNAVTKDKYLIFGTGSTQLINALIYALSPENSSSPASIVATPPFYPMYKSQTDLFNGREYEWEGITSNWVNSTVKNFIEFVTAPNNPDGLMHEPILGGSSVIYDHAYYWPHFTAIPYSADGDVMLFSCSKSSGHAGSRFGQCYPKLEETKIYSSLDSTQ